MVLLPRARSTKAGLGPEAVAAFLARVVPGAVISRADRPALGKDPGHLTRALKADVIVATEAALAEVQRPPISLAVALGVDSYFQRPSGRAAEDTFATLHNLARLVAGAQPKGRLLVETDNSDHHVVQALVRGDYRYFATNELTERLRSSNPPYISLIRVTAYTHSRGEAADQQHLRTFLDGLTEELGGLPGVGLLGPLESDQGAEFLLKTKDLEPILDRLGSIVSVSKERIHVEMDPRQW